MSGPDGERQSYWVCMDDAIYRQEILNLVIHQNQDSKDSVDDKTFNKLLSEANLDLERNLSFLASLDNYKGTPTARQCKNFSLLVKMYLQRFNQISNGSFAFPDQDTKSKWIDVMILCRNVIQNSYLEVLAPSEMHLPFKLLNLISSYTFQERGMLTELQIVACMSSELKDERMKPSVLEAIAKEFIFHFAAISKLPTRNLFTLALRFSELGNIYKNRARRRAYTNELATLTKAFRLLCDELLLRPGLEHYQKLYILVDTLSMVDIKMDESRLSRLGTVLEKHLDKYRNVNTAKWLIRPLSLLEQKGVKPTHISQLDEVYTKLFGIIIPNIKTMHLRDLSLVCSVLTRSRLYYEEVPALVLRKLLNTPLDIDEAAMKKINGIQQELEKCNEAISEMVANSLNTSGEYRVLMSKSQKLSAEIASIREAAKRECDVMGPRYYRQILVYLSYNFQLMHDKIPSALLEALLSYSELFSEKLLAEKGSMVEVEEDRSELCIAMWALCVLYPAEKLSRVVPNMFHLLDKSIENIPLASLNAMTMVIEFMKAVYVHDGDLALRLRNKLKEIRLKEGKQVSLLNLDVCKALESLNVMYEIEKQVNNLDVDILVKGIGSDPITVCIDIHGYQHYFRNKQVLLGKAYFKRKLIKKMGMHYFEIPIFIWEMLDQNGKKNYLKEGLTAIRKL
jgi:hypothetical protein